MPLCPHCGGRVPSRTAAYTKRLRAERKKQGKCVACGVKKDYRDARRTNCWLCRVKNTEWMRRHRKKLSESPHNI